ncbi:hypothetical protein NQD34_000805 [Periophthalmus magnuspinnatus]|nr:hypothetical protein NQD34_000805 [Periophthalmus magnuspinnatus]
MTYTVVSYIILVGFLMTSVSASELNDTGEFENSNLTTPITSDESIYDTENATMSTITHGTVNQTDITQTSASTPQEHPPPATPTAPRILSSHQPTLTPAKPVTKTRGGFQGTLTTTPKPSDGNESVGIIILVVIIVIALLTGFVCFVTRRRARRYSVDLSSRPDEAQIPLSTVEPEGPVETATANGLQFDGTENSTQEAEEPEVKTKEQVEQKEKVTLEASAECAAPTVDNPDEQPKQDTSEPSPSAPTEPSPEEKTDDEGGEGAASNKTSVESLKESNEANENNSNSSLLPQRGAREGEAFCDVSLDNMV